MKLLLSTITILCSAQLICSEDVRLLDLEPQDAQQHIESKDTTLKYAPKIDTNVPAVRYIGNNQQNVLEDIYLANQYHGQDGLGGYLYGYSVPDIAKTEKKKAGGDLRGAYNYISGNGKEIKVEYWDDGTGFHQVDNVDRNQPEDLPDVKAAKEEHLRLWHEQAERNSKPVQSPYNAEGQYASGPLSAQGQLERQKLFAQQPQHPGQNPFGPQFSGNAQQIASQYRPSGSQGGQYQPQAQGSQQVGQYQPPNNQIVGQAQYQGGQPSNQGQYQGGQAGGQGQYQTGQSASQGQYQGGKPGGQGQYQGSQQGQYQPTGQFPGTGSSTGQYQGSGASSGPHQASGSSSGQYQGSVAQASAQAGGYQSGGAHSGQQAVQSGDQYSGQYSENRDIYSQSKQQEEKNEEENGPPRGFFYNFDYPVGIIVQKQGGVGGAHAQKRESDIKDIYATNKANFERQLTSGSSSSGSSSGYLYLKN